MNYEFLIKELFLMTGSIGFIFCLNLLSSPKTAKKGNILGMLSMCVIIIVYVYEISNCVKKTEILLILLFLSTFIGLLTSKKIKMTEMPQLVAVFNGLGGLSSTFVSIVEILNTIKKEGVINNYELLIAMSGIMIGAITFTGSFVAYLKLQELISSSCIIFYGHKTITTFTILILLLTVIFCNYNNSNIEIINICLFFSLFFSFFLGILLVIPIGGADMPVVISLLNSYSGIAACLAGFVINNKVLIISGSLVGASGIILTKLMCQAMNRSIINVTFGAFYIKVSDSLKQIKENYAREYLPVDAAILLNNSNKVIIVPGYGLAVSQAQHNIKEISNILKENNINVKYAIHPVAGRMPGHMNVLLAEADVSYEDLLDLEQVNQEFEDTDTVLIVGANDVVNPLARTEKTSPIYGMPILNADKSKNIIVFKRGKGKGFSGIDNPLFYMEKTGTIYGDAKKSIVNLINEIKALNNK